MDDLLERSFLVALGLLLLVHERADEFIKDLISKGKISPEEGKQYMEDLSKRVNVRKEQLEKLVIDSLRSALKKAGMATESDFEKLDFNLRELENRIVVLENKMEVLEAGGEKEFR
ncbi:MAG: hypothetical protein AB1466_03760 [Actinomycetota bacterium]